jgi:hypothetical protein
MLTATEPPPLNDVVTPSPDDLTPEAFAAMYPADRRPAIATIWKWLRTKKLVGYKTTRSWLIKRALIHEFFAKHCAASVVTDDGSAEPEPRRRRRANAARVAAEQDAAVLKARDRVKPR